jgi:hypothetical protein
VALGPTDALCQHQWVRPATTIALGLLLVAIFAAAMIQFLILAH